MDTSNGRNPSQFNSPTDENLRKMPIPPGHGNNGCPNCHIAGTDILNKIVIRGFCFPKN